ncbi:MAG: DUF2461 domain-containing protein [Longicatena sp.]
MNMNIILDYLLELRRNNCREWYAAHKEERKIAEKEFEAFLQELIIRISEFDESVLFHNPKDLTFKMVRDTRFSNDKSPYNPTFRAHISSKGKYPIPVGYYISISPEDMSFLGGGLFTDMFTNATTMIRDYICNHGDEFLKIISDPSFCEHFTLKGTSLKNVPRGYDKEHPMASYLKYKSFYLEYYVEDNLLMDSETFLNLAVEKFKAMQAFNDFLNKALVEFKMPTR